MSGVVARDGNGQRLVPGTYYILRSDDRHAYAALWGLAQAMHTTLELGRLDDGEREELSAECARVEEMAKAWQAASR